MNNPRTVRVGIIGGGFGALITYVILRFRGVPGSDIAVFSPDPSPEKSWENFARAINVKSLRSESTGHFYPTDSPGLATVQAVKTWRLWPIIQSWFDRYHPTVDFFLEHTRNIARQTGFYRALVPGMISKIERREDNFSIYDKNETLVAVAQHIMLAVGHGRERLPEAIENFRRGGPQDPRVVPSFESKTYHPQSALVIGDGITAATEWANILEAGGAVSAVSLHGFNLEQPLQVPRRYFSRRGLSAYRRKSQADRLAELQAATRGTIPPDPAWKKLFAQAQQTGRLGLAKGFVKSIAPAENGRLACEVEFTDQHITHTIVVDQVISATGFLPPSTHPLLARLIEQYALPAIDGILQLTDDCCVEKISTPNSILAVVGAAAAWAIPSADSFVGMKISARAFARLVAGPENLSVREVMRQTRRWTQLVTGKALL